MSSDSISHASAGSADTGRTAVDRFDAAMRAKAAKAGHPIPRTAASCPGFARGLRYLVFRHDPRRRRLMVMEDGQSEVATAEHVSRAFRDPGLGALVLDRKAANALFSLVPADDRPLALSVAGHLASPVSFRLFDLAAACTSRFWAPSGVDVTSGDAWLAAFGASAPEAPLAAARAAEAEGLKDSDDSFPERLRRLIRKSMGELDRALNPGDGAGNPGWVDRNFAFGLVEALTEFTATLAVCDPRLRRRGLLTGDLVRAEVMRAGRGPKQLRLSAPISVKQGEEVTVLPEDPRVRPGPGLCRLARYAAENGSLHAECTFTRQGESNGLRVIEMAGEGATVLLANAKPPFMNAPQQVFTRWQGRKVSDHHRKPRKRPVPSYIVLAGGGSGVSGIPSD